MSIPLFKSLLSVVLLFSARRPFLPCSRSMTAPSRPRPWPKSRPGQAVKVPLRTDPKSIAAGKDLFSNLCSGCHYMDRTDKLVGPGLKGVLKGPRLPRSGRPATPENVFRQLRQPFKDMPSFKHIPDEEVFNIIAYLNTL